MPVPELRVGQAPAEPGRLALAQGGDVDEAGVEVANDHAERLEVIEQVADPRPELGRGGLQPRLLLRPPVPVAAQPVMQRIVRVVRAAALDRELEQRSADQWQERAGLLDGVDRVIVHRSRRW